MIPTIGATKIPSTYQEEKLGLTRKRPSYRHTGIHLSPRSVLVWRLTTSSTLLSLTERLNLCTHWLLMETTATPHWPVTPGRRWLAPKLPCSFCCDIELMQESPTWICIRVLEKKKEGGCSSTFAIYNKALYRALYPMASSILWLSCQTKDDDLLTRRFFIHRNDCFSKLTSPNSSLFTLIAVVLFW